MPSKMPKKGILPPVLPELQISDYEPQEFTSVEVCAGAGGQALGLHAAGFQHSVVMDNDRWCCETLRKAPYGWQVEEGDLATWDASKFKGTDLFAGGLPCPPFSVAGKQLGADDERNLFDHGLRVIEQISPRAVMIENVRGILDPRFAEFRSSVLTRLEKMGYFGYWKLFNASWFGVPQLRPRVILVALKSTYAEYYIPPRPTHPNPPSVGETLRDLMAANGWEGAEAWAEKANSIAPTVVGGSKKHGGPDLGPTRARREWAKLGVDGMTIANDAPPTGFVGMPKLTVRMVARIQGFPDWWRFAGVKTHAYRQVGNAFPPPVARAIGIQIAKALRKEF